MTVSHDKCGVVIVGINKGADTKALRVAESVKKQMSDIRITFFTDLRPKSNYPYFDKVVYIPNRIDNPCFDGFTPQAHGIAAKTYYMNKCDYEYIIYLDYDVYVTDSLWEIFDALDSGGYDLALTQYQFHEGNYIDIPSCFPYFNAGVLAWRKNPKTDKFFEIWWNKYLQMCCEGSNFDEVALQRTLYELRDFRYFNLPLEYNFRSLFPGTVGSKIKIIHGIPAKYRLKGMTELANRINGINERVIRVIYEDEILATYTVDGKFLLSKEAI